MREAAADVLVETLAEDVLLLVGGEGGEVLGVDGLHALRGLGLRGASDGHAGCATWLLHVGGLWIVELLLHVGGHHAALLLLELVLRTGAGEHATLTAHVAELVLALLVVLVMAAVVLHVVHLMVHVVVVVHHSAVVLHLVVHVMHVVVVMLEATGGHAALGRHHSRGTARSDAGNTARSASSNHRAHAGALASLLFDLSAAGVLADAVSDVEGAAAEFGGAVHRSDGGISGSAVLEGDETEFTRHAVRVLHDASVDDSAVASKHSIEHIFSDSVINVLDVEIRVLLSLDFLFSFLLFHFEVAFLLRHKSTGTRGHSFFCQRMTVFAVQLFNESLSCLVSVEGNHRLHFIRSGRDADFT